MRDSGRRSGPINHPVTHGEWEARTFAVAGGALGAGGFNTPMFRHAIERMDPGHYLTSSYFEHWLTAVATLLVEDGMISRDDLDARVTEFPLSRPPAVDADDVDAASPRETPRFAVGDAVRVRDVHFGGHTRCPQYVRGRRGVVARIDVAAPIPGGGAPRARARPHVRGAVRRAELWSEAAEANAPVHVDMHQQYWGR
jgi:nitrile hydratase